MLKKLFYTFFVSILCSVLFGSAAAHAAVTEVWGDSTGKDGILSEYYRATGNVSVISEGTGLSNPRSGTITISGIPNTATVKQAWLYYGGYVINVTADQLSKVNFEGQEISLTSSPAAVQIGQESSRTNGTKERRAYRADVSSLINAGGNGTYDLSVTSHTKKDTFGASLVIVYEDLGIENGTVVINDGMVMISKSSPGNVAGTEYTSTITGLTLSDPPNGQVTVAVSEGTAQDSTELDFTGSSTHTFGDFTNNSDNLVWDDKRIDAAPYLDVNTTSVSATLKDLDTSGAFVHYFFMIFQTNLLEGDLSESSLTVSEDQPNPGEGVEMNIVVDNSENTTANNVVFEMDLPSNVSYSTGTIEVNNVAETDSDADGDGTYFDNVNKKVYIELGNIPGNTSKSVDFFLDMAGGLDHNTNIPVQGLIRSTSQTVLTDGDGFLTDGIDRPTWITIYGGKFINLGGGLSTYLASQPSFDPASSRKTGTHTVRFKKGSYYIAELPFNLNDDVDANVISADSNATKSFVHGFGDLPEGKVTQATYSLKFNCPNEETQVRICRGAQSLDEVEEGCLSHANVSAETVIDIGETVSGMNATKEDGVCTVSGIPLSGTGGQGEGGGGGGGAVPEFAVWTYLLMLGACLYFMRDALKGAAVAVYSFVFRKVLIPLLNLLAVI